MNPRKIAVILFLLFAPSAFCVDYPGGATTYGVVVSVGTFNSSLVRFAVQGTKANGQSGTEAFWLDTSQVDGKNHYANVLSASAQGRAISVWHYGEQLNSSGQTGYRAVIVWANY